MSPTPSPKRPSPKRMRRPLERPSRYPQTPHPAVLAVVPREGRVLLVRRANSPDAGKWGFPGGRLGLGETVEDAAIRELVEETGVRAVPYTQRPPLASLDVIDRDAANTVRYHFVLIAILCQWVAGEGCPADDVTECKWMNSDEISALGGESVCDHVDAIALMALGSPKSLSDD